MISIGFKKKCVSLSRIVTPPEKENGGMNPPLSIDMCQRLLGGLRHQLVVLFHHLVERQSCQRKHAVGMDFHQIAVRIKIDPFLLGFVTLS